MKLIIIPSDNTVIVNGVSAHDLDLSFIPSNVHAVQWYGDHGEIEIEDEYGRMVANQPIHSIDQFQAAIDAWEAATAEE
jgi:hypothetical protein